MRVNLNFIVRPRYLFKRKNNSLSTKYMKTKYKLRYRIARARISKIQASD